MYARRPIISNTNVAMVSFGSSRMRLPFACRRSAGYAFQERLESEKWTKKRLFSTKGALRKQLPVDSPLRVSQLLGALVVLGVGATSWGLYEFYTTLTMWPKEVRGDLRAGLKAKHHGDMKLARRHLQKAWETIQTMPPESLSPDPYLKFSGVAVVFAEVLETEHELDEAFSVLKTALTSDFGVTSSVPLAKSSASASSSKRNSSSRSREFREFSEYIKTLVEPRSSYIKSQVNGKVRMRVVALALKLGDLAETLHRPEEEEHFLSFALTEVLQLIRDEYRLTFESGKGFVSKLDAPPLDVQRAQRISDEEAHSGRKGQRQQEADDNVGNILNLDAGQDELELPSWASLTKTELAAPMERLGAYYARQGKYEEAILLHRLASSLLVRPKNKGLPPSVQELCQALQIENAHMALMMNLRRSQPNSNAMVQRDLPRILKRAVQIHSEALKQHGRGRPREDTVTVDSEVSLCEETYPAVLYNAGVYYEEEGQLEQALHSYSSAYNALRGHGSREMMYEALENARRLQRMLDKKGVDAGRRNDSSASATSSNEPQEKPIQR